MNTLKRLAKTDVKVVAVDPGRWKCGIAVLSEDGKLWEQRVVPRDEIFSYLAVFHRQYGPYTLVVGDRTGSKEFLADLQNHPIRSLVETVYTVDEHLSTLEARSRYFSENPPSGLKRFIPRTMLSPPVDIDDYVAVILAERFLRNQSP